MKNYDNTVFVATLNSAIDISIVCEVMEASVSRTFNSTLTYGVCRLLHTPEFTCPNMTNSFSFIDMQKAEYNAHAEFRRQKGEESQGQEIQC
tara:strand:- start:184 stop:459 length:276 start_codon:yes stop_codon:yes gene_type:complete